MNRLTATLGTWHVFVAGVALVVAAATLVSDFTGFFALGGAFAVALVIGFGLNLLLGLSAADLAVSHPRAGALYDYARAVIGGEWGRIVGAFLGLAFFGTFGLAAAGETTAGAFGLQSLIGLDLPIGWYIVVLSLLAAIPNILGIRTTAWVSACLLLLMLGIRWFFGIAGFLGLGNTGSWSAANLDAGPVPLFGDGGIISVGVALALFTFIGIEFACSLAEETRAPKRSLPRGIVLGLLAILATSLVMGLGVTGSAPLEVWRAASAGPAGMGGEAPQLAVGERMFGAAGRWLMALASVCATLGTLTVALAAMPRILYSLGRDGRFLGERSSRLVARLHPRFGTPVAATVITTIVYLVPALYNSAVVDWLYSAAYVWMLLYVVFHLLAILNRRSGRGGDVAFEGRWFVPVAWVGVAATIGGIYLAFAGSHTEHGTRALVVLGIAALVVLIERARLLGRPRRSFAPRPAGAEGYERMSEPT